MATGDGLARADDNPGGVTPNLVDVPTAEDALQAAMASAVGVDGVARVDVVGAASLTAAYPVSELAATSVATAAGAAAALSAVLGLGSPAAVVRRPLADAWFGMAVRGHGWSPPPVWDAIAGDYRGRDGWIRLHTNAAHHREAALRVLGVGADRSAVAAAVARRPVLELEEAIVAAGGCAARLMTPADWRAHPQGAAVASRDLVEWTIGGGPAPSGGRWSPRRDRPLAGLRVLDLTRVLAGPVATRLLAGLGADVLRLDPPWWEEPAVVPEMTLGKRVARLDARTREGRERLTSLLAEGDVLVHGYRPGALAALGLPPDARSALRPGLVDVSLTAYGDSGPWGGRRGFDSLVQMSTGIAAAGLVEGTADRPTPLPVQALDHATGYLMAAAVLAGLARRVQTGKGSRAVLSLARTAVELAKVRDLARAEFDEPPELPATPISTPWGPASVLEPPLALDGVPIRWERGPAPLGSDAPEW
jgi:crotonobetainyl-CoA:carnitine CoA-transferase CaiB-like acyl-CoA transferase